jgi:hypothetical protein
LLLNRLSATEEISSLFAFDVELLHDEGDERTFDPTFMMSKLFWGKRFRLTFTSATARRAL